MDIQSIISGRFFHKAPIFRRHETCSRNVARVFVASPEGAPHTLASFHTLSAASVQCSDLPAAIAREMLAVAGLVVDAKDHDAARFYKHLGFSPLNHQSQRIFLSMQVLRGLAS